MAIKNILVPLDGSNTSTEVLETALVVANRFGAHIDALHVTQIAGDSLPYRSYRLPARLEKTVLAQAEEEAKQRAIEVRAKFEEFCRRNKVLLSERPIDGVEVTAALRQVTGHVAEVLVRHGHFADLITIARPQLKPSTLRRSPVGENLEAMMLRTGRPILIVPPNWKARRVQSVVIGWNGSLEASRSLAMAMPWLPQMRDVTVLVSKKKTTSAESLVDYLAWHGVRADTVILSKKGRTVGETILSHCAEVGAEFLVVGGFSHSRARELMFGGVTKFLLAHSDILTVMVH